MEDSVEVAAQDPLLQENESATHPTAPAEDSAASEMTRKRSQSQEGALERRKRRRRLRRILREAGDFPSFVALISNVEDDVSDDKSEEKDTSPEVIYIDVDEYLGLAPDKHDTPAARASHAVEQVSSATPQEEGFYTGRVPVAMPDSDPQYLSTLQQLIRSNLEFFSATAKDAAKTQSGRRYPVVEVRLPIHRFAFCTPSQVLNLCFLRRARSA